MKVKLLQIERSNKSIETIENLLLPITNRANSQITVDDILERSLHLRVPFTIKGSIIHMVLHTIVRLEEKNGAVIISCFLDILKPLFLSLLFGILVATPILAYGAYFKYALVALVTFSVCLIIILNRTIRTLKNCMKELKI